MISRRLILSAAALMFFPLATAQAGVAGGIGVLGDSYSDEYEFYPPDRSHARNWVEILAATRGLNFGRWSAASRGEPQNQGFEYNWARSDATTDDMIETGQHTGLAAQVADGKVKLVVIFIGGNDFIAVYKSPDPWATLASITPRAKKNFSVALKTILQASPDVQVLVSTVPDVSDLPEFQEPIRDGRIPSGLPAAVDRSIRGFNSYIRDLAGQDSRVAVVDSYMTAKVVGLIAQRQLVVAGRTVDRVYTGNDPDHFFLNDQRHAGTVGQGLLAKLIVDTVNSKFNAGIPPLTEQEIVTIARLVSAGSPVVAESHGRSSASHSSWSGELSSDSYAASNRLVREKSDESLVKTVSSSEE